MPFTCVVPGCKGNYRSGPKVQVFSFPKDPELHRKWLRAIRRDNFTPTKNSKVCELHFLPTEIRRETAAFDERTGKTIRVQLKVAQLIDGSIPSQLPSCPSYLSGSTFSRPNPEARRIEKEESAIAAALANSLITEEAYLEERTFTNLVELSEKLKVDSSHWTLCKREGSVAICHIECELAPVVTHSLVVKNDLCVHVFFKNVELRSIGNYRLPLLINNINDIDKILELLTTSKGNLKCPSGDNAQENLKFICSLFKSVVKSGLPKNQRSLEFLLEQIHLLTQTKYVYSSETMIFSSLLFSISPQGYRFLRNSDLLTLPNASTIRRVTMSHALSPAVEQCDSNFLLYITQKYKLLSPSDKIVVLMLDEIHLNRYFDYKGGNIVGSAFNSDEAATSAHVFMVSSVFSKFKDVVHMIPCKSIIADTLFSFVKKVIVGLEEIGFKVICVLSDNNAINKKAMSAFTNPPKWSIVYPHPADISRPLFYLFDSVHILKCVRNNWLAQKDVEKIMHFPNFNLEPNHECNKELKASFCALRLLCQLESESLLKYSYRLSAKALSPTNFEKQNVKLVLQIFNDYVIQALLSLGEEKNIPNFADTAKFLRIFQCWWNVMNVKTPFKGYRLNDGNQNPLTNGDNDQNLIFLKRFVDWLDVWESLDNCGGKLSRETHCALRHTTHGMIELASYCISELNMTFILPGKFQTDCLESRFGKYRQLSGSNYNVSLRQIFESEKKLRVMSMLELSLPFKNESVNLKLLQENWDDVSEVQSLRLNEFHVEVTEEDINRCSDYLPVITYLAGYCCYAVHKRNKCESCKSMMVNSEQSGECLRLNDYIKGIDRGSLLYPNVVVVHIVLYNYVITEKLSSENFFNSALCQRNIVTQVTLSKLIDDDIFVEPDFCENGHSSEDVQKMIVWASTNTLLNNLCVRRNEKMSKVKSDKLKKRKLQTLLA